MGVERHHRPVAEAFADDEVGAADHAVGPDQLGRHRMSLDREAQPFEQRRGARRVGVAVAGRVVGWDLDQLGQEARGVVLVAWPGSCE